MAELALTPAIATAFPLWLTISYTVFLCVLVPVYVVYHGWQNFLWFSDVALFGTLAALWLENSLLASMMALAVLVPETVWILDFVARSTLGIRLTGLTDYMFESKKPRFVRALSLFHLVLPVLLLWMLARLGYDSRALPAQTALSCLILVVTYLLTDPERNINWAFGPGNKPQRKIPPQLYLLLLIVGFPLFIYLPLHFVLEMAF